MKRQHPWFLAVVAIVVLLIAGIPSAAAGPARRPAHLFPAHSPSRAVITSRAADGKFFQGHGGSLNGPFSLMGGRYELDVWARYNSLYDATGFGQCLFTAYMNGVEHPQFLSLGTAVPVVASGPYHFTPTVYFPAGHFKLIVSPASDCDWSVTILRHGPAVTGIDVAEVDILHKIGGTFTPTTTVRMGETITFALFYSLTGLPGVKATGRIAISENGRDGGSYPLRVGPDINGFKQLYQGIVFTLKSGDTPGPATVTLTVTAGKFHVARTVKFTLKS